LVKLAVSIGNLTNVDESLVLGQHLEELEGDIAEWSGGLESLVKLLDLLGSDSLVLSEESEGLAVGEELLKIFDILENVVELALSGGVSEKNTGVSAFDSIFLAWWLVVWGRLDLLDVAN